MNSLMLMATLAIVPQPQSFRISGRALPDEGYRIRIDAEGKAKVEAADEAGRYYANVTLGQLDGVKGPLEIEDWPRYSWRGVMLDESRFFFGKETVKAVLDEMARYKLNVFHWHLTDDQGWRIDVPGLPEIVQKGAVRAHSWKPLTENESDGTPYGPHFYTADDVREVVAYARARHIRVVPEIELPGHVGALLASHPEFSCEGFLQPSKMPRCEVGISDIVLCAGNDEAIRVMERVLDEVTKLFPDSCMHIGGDECPKAKWKACAKCQARMKSLGLKDENSLQAWLTRHFVGYLKAKGRRVVGWDEILEGGELDPSAIVQCWRPAGWVGTGGTVAETPGGVAVGRGHDIIVSPVDVTYFSMPWAKDCNRICWRRPLDSYCEDELVTIEKLKAFDPATSAGTTNRVHVLGAEGCNWTEGTRDAATLKAKMWPRTAVLAETLWTGAGQSDASHRASGF